MSVDVFPFLEGSTLAFKPKESFGFERSGRLSWPQPCKELARNLSFDPQEATLTDKHMCVPRAQHTESLDTGSELGCRSALTCSGTTCKIT